MSRQQIADLKKEILVIQDGTG